MKRCEKHINVDRVFSGFIISTKKNIDQSIKLVESFTVHNCNKLLSPGAARSGRRDTPYWSPPLSRTPPSRSCPTGPASSHRLMPLCSGAETCRTSQTARLGSGKSEKIFYFNFFKIIFVRQQFFFCSCMIFSTFATRPSSPAGWTGRRPRFQISGMESRRSAPDWKILSRFMINVFRACTRWNTRFWTRQTALGMTTIKSSDLESMKLRIL